MELELVFRDSSGVRYERVPARVAPIASRNVTGYGRAIPSPNLVKWRGRWRRVYICRFGNAGTAYIGKPGNWLATVESV